MERSWLQPVGRWDDSERYVGPDWGRDRIRGCDIFDLRNALSRAPPTGHLGGQPHGSLERLGVRGPFACDVEGRPVGRRRDHEGDATHDGYPTIEPEELCRNLALVMVHR